MLANVWPKVLAYLMKRIKVRTQVEFATACGVSTQSPSRWATGKHRIEKSFSEIATGSKLTENELGYVYAWFVMEHYKPYRFDLGLDSEIREPAAPYDAASILERVRALPELDVKEVPLDLGPPLSEMRREIDADAEELVGLIHRQEARLEAKLRLFEKHLQAARDLAKRLRGSRPG